MVERDRKFFQQGINMYVKAMQMSFDVQGDEPTEFQLGSPIASSATAVQTGVAANSAANTDSAATTYVSDANYGRTLIYTPSGDPGNSNAVAVYGQDYLGQPMVEQFVGASGSTAVVYGKKAFFRVLKSRNITPSSNGITYSIGTGTKLGIPYKGDLAYALENAIMVPIYKRDFQLPVNFAVADAVSGASQPVVSPCPGFVKNVFGAGTTTGSTNPSVLTVTLGGTAITGLTASIVQNANTFASGNPTTPGYNANNRLLTNSGIVILTAAAASAKGFVGGVTITPTQWTFPDLTDPGTVATGDPRGLYEPITAPAGNPIIVAMVGENSVNAAGNGGLMGLQHYFSAAGT